MNLEPGSKRTAEISKLLYDKYLSEIQFDSDTSCSVSFSQNAEINMEDLKDPSNFKLPFGIGAYEPNLLLSLVNEKVIDIHSLNRIRQNFTKLYFENETNKKYPNVLLDYQKEIADAGHFEAYNYWLLNQGEPEEFEKWKSENEEKWTAFIDWFKDNNLHLDEENRLHSTMY